MTSATYTRLEQIQELLVKVYAAAEKKDLTKVDQLLVEVSYLVTMVGMDLENVREFVEKI